MRLPEAMDCESIGHSIGLNDNQILELSKLDKGVAAIFQNDWLETVLTKIDKCSDRYAIDSVGHNDIEAQKTMLYLLLEELINEQKDGKYNPIWLKDIIKDNSEGVNKTLLLKTEKLIADFCENVKECSERKAQNILAELIARLVNCNDLIQMHEKDLPKAIRDSSLMTTEIRQSASNWIEQVYKGLDRYVNFMDESIKKKIFHKVIWHYLISTNEPDRYTVVLYVFHNDYEKE